ncbi:MAG: L-histidine N(alpha)-methyltransferase [Rhodocyclaceae bacterium]|nr:L-histidine N(alpha)-methyltransferase [Rhodocyclaceae bacterium]MBX3667585.1 L-histidine N(alpha)-methyltransferase [Rhodocyclaceae bacterium]
MSAAWGANAAPAGALASDFERAFLAGLSANPRSVPPKYFYDAAGSALFDRICDLPEYYVTRTEIGILRERAADIADCIGPAAQIIEFGAGSVLKIRLLLDALHAPAGFVPIDISGTHLQAAARTLRRDYPGLAITPLVGDFTAPLVLPPLPPGARRVGFFPGSSIGNFTPCEAQRFLRQAAHMLRGGGLLIGADLVKDPAVLHAAYNDAQGVTAAFNRNLLERARRELNASVDVSAFDHYAFYNVPQQRVEMHLVSRRRQRISVAGQHFEFGPGSAIHTENSCKYTLDGFRALAVAAGFKPGPVWCDERQWFSLQWLQGAED